MREEDRMVHLDKIESVAKSMGVQHRRENFRSLEVVQIFDPVNKEWVTFDPVHQAKDVVKMLWLLAKRLDGYDGNDLQFRVDMLNWVLEIGNEDGKTDAVS